MFTKEYEEDGTVRTKYFSSGGSPVTLTAGYSVLEQYYDEANRMTGEAYFNANGDPVELQAGHAKLEITYNENGTTTRTYLDLEGNVVKTEER